MKQDPEHVTRKPQAFLRWAGSKRKLLAHLRPYWSGHSRYIEPFTGSACLFFDLGPSQAVLSDINRDLVETYIAVRDDPEAVHKAANELPRGEKNYYLIRNIDPHSLDQIDKAARFVYLNRYCFNGLYRTNNSGKFNVPFGRSKTGDIPNLEAFISCAKSLANADLVCGDFEAIVRQNVRASDFVYLDPPYAVKNGKIFTQYDANSFGTIDLERLAALLDYIVEVGANFMLSYALCEEAKEFFGKWNYKIVSTQRNIAGFSHNRKVNQEIIFSSSRVQ
jgi:DNA adenine methylase